MSEKILEAVGLGKRFLIGARPQATLLPRLAGAFGGGSTRPLWAVRGVDLSLSRGEALGVLGANGAGKTTLLRLLSGLLEPTEGSARAFGRVTPFLGLGSALYGEITVRDNLRLCATLLGLTGKALALRLGAMVEFGGLEEYEFARLGELSAGYQARVLFAAALHSDIDVLLVDEVFAVGDAVFSRRCLDRMQELRRSGMTLVLASHDLGLLSAVCDHALWLQAGLILQKGAPAEVVARYREASASST